MKQIKFFIGLDVHKNIIAYAVRTFKGQIAAYGECATRFDDIYKALEPYLGSCKIGIESCTSYYHIYQGFKNKGCNIVVANTLRIRQLIMKNDRLDAERLSDMLRLGTFPVSYVPDERLQKLRTLVNLRHNFVEESTRFQNQIHSILSKYGLIINEITPFSNKWCEKLRFLMSEKPGLFELNYAFDHYLLIESKIENLNAELVTLCKKYWDGELELLCSIPGIGNVLSCYLIAEICPISRFSSEKKLRRYAGVIPCFQESGGHNYGSSLPKGSSRSLLRWSLIQGSHAAVKGKNRIAQYFRKKKKTRKYQRAIMATASSLCDIIFRVLSTKKPYVI